MIKQKLMDQFGKGINHMSCIYLGDGENVLRYFLEKCGKIDTAIEIGTYQGVSAAIIAEYAKKVFTFDIVDLPLRKKIWDFLGLSNIEFKLIKNNQAKAEEIKKINSDFAFIDGEHFHEELKNDFEMTKHIKHILIHDYSPGFKEVYDFCNNIKGFKKEIKGSFCFLTREQNEKISTENLNKVKTIPDPEHLDETNIKEETKPVNQETLVQNVEEKPRKRRGRRKKII